MNILHATDFSECADQAQEQAVRLARALGAEVILLHVSVETPLYGEGLIGMGEVQKIYEAQRKWAETTLDGRTAEVRNQGVVARWLLRTGMPHEEVVRAAEEEGAELIAMGTHGRGGLNRLLLGSVADRVIRAAGCPVLTLREAKPARARR